MNRADPDHGSDSDRDETDDVGDTRQNRGAWRAPVLVMVAGLGITGALMLGAVQRERKAQAGSLDERAARVTDDLRTNLALPVEVLQGVGALFDASKAVSRAQFRDYVRGALNRYPAIDALEWIPRVPQRERAAVESAARAEGLPAFQITEENAGRMVRAEERAEYLPIAYMEPLARAELGLDLLSSPALKRAVLEASETGQPRATARLHLVDTPDAWSVAVVQPVYRRGVDPHTPAERKEALLGYVAVVFRTRPVISQVLHGVDVTGLSLRVDDRSAPEAESLLFSVSPEGERGGEPGSLLAERTLPFAGRQWALRFESRVVPTATEAALLWGLSIGGLIISALLATMVSASRIIRRLRRQVRAALHLGQYTLDEKIGSGGMGVVYRASHAMLRRPTAVKLLEPSGKRDEEDLRRFEREVQLTARLTHPNTVAIYDYGRTPDGVFYYAMEYLDGISLDQLVRADGAQPPARVALLLRQILGALAEAHGIGLIHRDIKPANLMLCVRGDIPDFVKVLDFGLVKEMGVPEDDGLTGEHQTLGTPQYLSPEAVNGGSRIDARADLYALGAVAYFLLTGKPVFTGRSVIEVCSQHLSAKPVPPSERLGHPLPEALEELVLSCLAKKPEDRPQSAQEMLEELDQLSADPALGRWTIDDARAWWAAHPAATTRAAANTPPKAQKKAPPQGKPAPQAGDAGKPDEPPLPPEPHDPALAATLTVDLRKRRKAG